MASFLAKSPEALSQISHAVLTGAAADVVHHAHKLKGSALNVGVPRVAASCAELQDIGGSADLGPAQAALEVLSLELDAALAELRALRDASWVPLAPGPAGGDPGHA